MNKIAPDIIYSTKVWLTSVLVSPLFLLFIVGAQKGFKGHLEDALAFMCIAALISFVLSIPCWVALMVAVRMVYNVEHSERKFKTIINIIAVGIALIIFAFILGIFYQPEMFYWVIPYFFTLTLGVWYFKLAPKEILTLTTIDHLIE